MSNWSIPLDRLANKYGLRLETVARRSAFELFTAVVTRSPVDTGRFRGNWNVSYGAPDLSTTLAANAGHGDAEASKAMSLPVGGVVYLSNGLPYARRLEYGWSKQAPGGMVRVSLVEYKQHINRALQA